MVNVSCKQCGGKFKVYLSGFRHGEGKFCSRKCHYKWSSENLIGKKAPGWKGGKLLLNCLVCKKEFKIFLCIIKIGKGKFCSNKCYHEWRSQNLKGKNNPMFGRKASIESRKKMSESHKGKRMGNANNMWKGGITPLNEKIRKSPTYVEWAKAVKERDGFICQVCNVRGGKLRSNHIKRFNDYPELRLDLTNGITICENCDLKFILHHEENCEDFFNFNLIERGYLTM